MTALFSAGCACGAVRCQSTAGRLLMLHCHCPDCLRSSGGPFSSFVIVTGGLLSGQPFPGLAVRVQEFAASFSRGI